MKRLTFWLETQHREHRTERCGAGWEGVVCGAGQGRCGVWDSTGRFGKVLCDRKARRVGQHRKVWRGTGRCGVQHRTDPKPTQ